MKKSYEMTREIFNKCSGNQMRDIFISEIEAAPEEIEAIARGFFSDADGTFERCDREGEVTFDIVNNGERQRVTFVE